LILRRLSLVSEFACQSLFPKSAHPDNKPGQEYRQSRQVKDLGLAQTPEHRVVSTEKPDDEITSGKNANEEEQQTTFGLELASKSPHNTEDYQPPQ
jgi:hypothetical protein